MVVGVPSGEPSETPQASPSPQSSPSPEPSPTPTASPEPQYGPLEMVYLGRQSALAPIYVLRRDFSTSAQPAIMAQSGRGINKYAWSPDGRVGACIIDGVAVALTPGSQGRTLAENVSALSIA